MYNVYMIYFISFVGLLIYFEILGQSIMHKIGKDTLSFSFGIGFILVLVICYLTSSVFTALDCSFYLILVLYSVYFILSLIFIFKEVKSGLKIKFSKLWIILIIMMAILTYYTFNTTLGELNGFDTTHYLNMVSSNIGLDKMNTRSVVFGTYNKDLSLQYTFQSYYYFVSVLLYLISKLCSLIKLEFFYPLGFIWIFQLMYFALLNSIIIITLKKLFEKKYLVWLMMLLILSYVLGKHYYNNIFGFYGNTLRTIIVAYGTLFLYEYFIDNNKINRYLFYTSLLAASALSSTAVFMVFFILFAFYFVEVKNNDVLFKEYAIVCFIPLINLLSVIRSGDVLIITIISSMLCFVLFILNKQLINISRKKYTRLIILLFSIILMAFLSYKITNNIFDFSAFLENSSERYDMTIDYFDFEITYNDIRLYKFLVLLLFGLGIIFNSNNKMIKIFIILIAVFFNPFCCSFLNEFNVVYYRAYELIINPFTFILIYYLIINKIKHKYDLFNNIITTIVIVLFISVINFKTPAYWHDDFIPDDDYNMLYKMTNKEIIAIKELKTQINYYDIKEPRIVTANILTKSFIPEGIYYYGREYQINDLWTKDEKAIYDIFWPVLHYGDQRQPENPDYENMCAYIENAKIDFLVQEKKIEYYDEEKDLFYSIFYKINECKYPFFESEEQAIYNFNE